MSKGKAATTRTLLERSCVASLVAFIKERHAIYVRRSLGQPKPWTKDATLLDYKFCNVYRELDTVTKWIAENWRTPHADDPDLWFAMVVARLVNKPSTLEMLGYPHTWNPAKFIRIIHALKNSNKPAFSGAYLVVAANKHKKLGVRGDKAELLCTNTITTLWQQRKYYRPRTGDTLAEFHARLTEHFGMGSFLGAQVVADMKYVKPLMDAEDFWTWASSGPGSRRGLNRVCGRPVGRGWREEDWLRTLRELQEAVNAKLATLPAIHAQDLQNCLCEFDKYRRVLLGEGRMKSRYNGRT